MKTTTFYRLLFIVLLCVTAVSTHAQFAFTNSNSLTPTASHSGCAVTVVDMNNDGLDDIVKMDQSTTLVIEMQNKNGTFTHYDLGNITGTSRVWGMAVADVDHNGWKDVAAGRNGSMYLVNLSWTGSTIAATTTMLAGGYFVQNVTFADFDNDGWADLFVCDDNDYAKVYSNTAGTLTLTTSLIDIEINPGLTVGGDPYDSGNYGSVWTDFDNDGDLDLYIAHCRQSASSSTDQRRRDRLFVNDGSNNYSEQAAAYGIEVTDFKQTWTTSFGDLDNDGDMDIVMTNHGENGQILQNNGTGHFTDITASAGFSTLMNGGSDPIESTVEDFDNDGFLDILISGGGPGDSYIMYRNNGNSTFTLVTSPFPSTSNGMLSFATGDLNHDGKIDVFASYGNVYNSPTSTDDVLYLNTTNTTNHFITFNLTGASSNIDAIGARVTIYGPWGKQVREVRAGESYGTANSMQIHFGLGQNTSVDSARIDWPSHEQTHLTSLSADQFVTAVESGCVITGNIIPGPFLICSGQTLTLSTGSFSSYDWSTGDNTPSIIVSASGGYNVTVTDNGCTNTSPSVMVQVSPDETPSVTAAGQLTFCEGGTVTLSSTPAASYLWSSGQTTQSINVSAGGPYAVTIQGLCAPFTSDSLSVNVLAAPLPVASDDSAHGPSSFTLQATGNSISWYDQQTGGTLLGTGTSYTTPLLNSTVTYWVENGTSYGGANEFTGQRNHTGASLYSGNTTNAVMLFDVSQPCTLATVKVYTDRAGIRSIQLKNSVGTVLNSISVNIPLDSSVVTLNFPLTPGTGYQLTTDGAVNNANLGYTTPRLQRSNTGVNYPYTLSNSVTVTGSDQGQSYYYYFYDWNVITPPTVCLSNRVPVQAIILAPIGIETFTAENSFQVYPNPAGENVTVSFNVPGTATSKVEFLDALGRVISSRVLENAGGNFHQVFDISNFAKGIYTIHVSSKDKTAYQQLVIQ